MTLESGMNALARYYVHGVDVDSVDLVGDLCAFWGREWLAALPGLSNVSGGECR